MAQYSMKELLQDAAKRGYAVPCFNAINLDMARGIIQAAEEEQSPVILCHAEIHLKYTPLAKLAPILVREMQEASVPVAVLLDHGKNFDVIMQAMHLGFNSIMFDGSELDYDLNVEKTREMVRIAHSLNVSVEGELGYVTRPRSGGAEGEDDDSISDDTSHYTVPEQARDFVEKTGVDALAVAFGTVHGIYLNEPKLDLARLDAIRSACGVPLVMHGGSGLSQDDFAQSIARGIAKINYYTGMALDASQRMKALLAADSDSSVYYHHLMMNAIESICQDARRVMRMFGSSGKA